MHKCSTLAAIEHKSFEVQTKYLLVLIQIGLDTAEKEPSEVSSNKGRLHVSARRHEASGWAIRAVCLKFPLATGFVATRLDPQD